MELSSPVEDTSSLRTVDDILQAIDERRIREHLHSNVELKEDWAQKHGAKISALANKLDQYISFLIVGVSDDGEPVGKSEKWATADFG